MFKIIKNTYGAGYRAGLAAHVDPVYPSNFILNYVFYLGWESGMKKQLLNWLNR